MLQKQDQKPVLILAFSEHRHDISKINTILSNPEYRDHLSYIIKKNLCSWDKQYLILWTLALINKYFRMNLR